MALNLTRYLDAVEEELQVVIPSDDLLHQPLYDMMRYHMGWLDAQLEPHAAPRGKRLRPLLCLLACQAVGGAWQQALPAAAALELVHNFSLIHDDIEDDSPLRHHRPTVWKLWGIAQGINTGDAMWTLSRLAVYRLLELGHSAHIVLEVAQRIDQTCLALCAGQYMDIAFEGSERVSVEAYEEMIAGKTAALISSALAIGALLGGADQELTATLGRFGRQLGLAFQMTDDLLGIWGDPQITGKSAATDILTRKMTLPVIYALEQERTRRESILAAFYSQESIDDSHLEAILDRLEVLGAQAYVRERALEYERQMIGTLDGLHLENEAADELRRLALTIVERRY